MTDYLRTLDSWSAFYPEERIFAGFLEDIHFFPEDAAQLVPLPRDRPVRGEEAITQRIHPGSVSEMPMRLAIYLARLTWKRQSIWRSASGATPRSGASAQSNWPRDRRKRERPGK